MYCDLSSVWWLFLLAGEAEDSQDVLGVLTAQGMDEYIFEALYARDIHIDVDKFREDVPYKRIHYLNLSISQKRLNPEKITWKSGDHYTNISSSAIYSVGVDFQKDANGK